MTVEMKSKLTLDASQYKSEMRSAGQEAEKTARQAGKELDNVGKKGLQLGNPLQAMVMGLTGAVAVTGGLRVAIGGAAVAMAQAGLESARLKGNTEGIYEAQLKVDDAWRSMAAGVPMIGPAIIQAMDAFGDRKGIEQALANIREVQAATENFEKLARQWARETALEKARLAKASESEIMRIRSGFAAEDRAEQLAAMQQNKVKALEAAREQQEKIYDIQRQIEEGRKYNEEQDKKQSNIANPFGGMHGDRVNIGLLEEQLQAEEILFKSLREKQRQAEDAYTKARQDDAEAAATAEASAAEKAAQERAAAERTISSLMMSETEKRKAAVNAEYDVAVTAAKKLGRDTADIERKRAEALAAVDKDVADKAAAESARIVSERAASEATISSVLMTETEKRKATINREFDAAVAAAKKLGRDTADIERGRAKALADVDKDVADRASAESKRRADERAVAEQRISAFTADETQARIDQVYREYDEAVAAAEVYGGDLVALAAARDRKIADIQQQSAQSELDRWRSLSQKKISEAEQLQARLDGIERGRQAAEESWYDRRIRQRMEGHGEKGRAAIAAEAAQEYQKRAGRYGDPEEQRQRLEKAMDYAAEAGDRKLMESIQNAIRKTFDAQEKTVAKAQKKNRAELKSFSEQLAGIEVRASSIKVDLDTSEARAKLRELGVPVSIRMSASARGYATGGHVTGPSGTDRVPAWLTAGEFVVNRTAAQANRGLLEALNRGGLSVPASAPRFAAGGAVGAGVGGYNDNRSYSVSVTGAPGSDSRAMARQILSELRRLERRGH